MTRCKDILLNVEINAKLKAELITPKNVEILPNSEVNLGDRLSKIHHATLFELAGFKSAAQITIPNV